MLLQMSRKPEWAQSPYAPARQKVGCDHEQTPVRCVTPSLPALVFISNYRLCGSFPLNSYSPRRLSGDPGESRYCSRSASLAHYCIRLVLSLISSHGLLQLPLLHHSLHVVVEAPAQYIPVGLFDHTFPSFTTHGSRFFRIVQKQADRISQRRRVLFINHQSCFIVQNSTLSSTRACTNHRFFTCIRLQKYDAEAFYIRQSG